MQVEGHHDISLLILMATGARVSNAYPTWPSLRDSLLKGRLIPDGFISLLDDLNKDLSVKDGDAFH